MKRHLTLTIAIMITGGVFALDAKAQTAATQTMRATVPFAFTVGEKNLPAGVYTVRVINPNSDRKALQVRSDDGRTSAIIQTLGVNGKLDNSARLVFRRYGDHYFFAQARMAGDPMTLAASRTRAERATQRALKQTGDPTMIAIVAH